VLDQSKREPQLTLEHGRALPDGEDTKPSGRALQGGSWTPTRTDRRANGCSHQRSVLDQFAQDLTAKIYVAADDITPYHGI
jgi:hypothetical protein